MWNGKLKAVTLSFDDGITQDMKLIELLNKYGLKCTFNLNSELLGNHTFLVRNNMRIAHYKFIPEDIRAVYDGHEVAVHTLTHPTLTELSEEEIIRQVEQDRINLERLVGYDVVGMAYPNGPNDDRVAEILKNKTKIKYSRTVTNTDSFDLQDNLLRFKPNVCGSTDFERLMKMAHEFVELKTDKPQIFYVWGHSYEFDYRSDAFYLFEEFCRLIGGRDDIFYGTNAEVLLKGEPK